MSGSYGQRISYVPQQGAATATACRQVQQDRTRLQGTATRGSGPRSSGPCLPVRCHRIFSRLVSGIAYERRWVLTPVLELHEMSRSHSGERGKCTHEDGYVPKGIQTALGLHHERLKCRECLLHVAEERGILGGLLVRSSSGYMRPLWSATGMKMGTCGTHTSLSMAAASSYSSRRV